MFYSLFSFTGRLNRAPFWGYSVLAVFVFTVVISVSALAALGPELAALAQMGQDGTTPDVSAIMAIFQGTGQRLGWMAIILQVVFAFPFAALSVKRRHDRDRSGIDVWIYLGLSIVLSILQLLGIGMTTGVVRDTIVPVPTLPMQLAQGAMLLFGLYLFVVLGFLKGTIGPNSYGPDPLGG